MALTIAQRASWDHDGLLVRPAFADAATVARLNATVDRLWQTREQRDERYVIDTFIGDDRAARTYFADAPDEARDHPYKLNDLFLTQPDFRDVALGRRLTPILAELLDGPPLICNSLNFEHGSQQPLHFDTFFMPSQTPGKMVASWLALEATTPDNGPLGYLPGSQKIPPYLFSNGTTVAVPDEMAQFDAYITGEIEARGLERIEFYAQPGDVFIWHSQLFHGGVPIIDRSATRRSLVTHYFTTDDIGDDPSVQLGEGGSVMVRDAQPVEPPRPLTLGQRASAHLPAMIRHRIARDRVRRGDPA